MRYPHKVLYNPQQEELIMSRQKAHHTKQFKLDAINYRKEHPDLTQVEWAKNLGIGVSTLARWEAQFRDNGGDIPVIGSGSYASEEEKEIARLKHELRDAQGALDVLKKPSAFWEKTDRRYLYRSSCQGRGCQSNWTPRLYLRNAEKLGVSRSGYRSFLNRKVFHPRQRKEAVKIETINKAKACRNTDRPLIIHSDRGIQYVSNAWRIATEKMRRSYSHSGYPYDNACIESFHSLIKREWLNRFNIINFKHAYRLIFEYIETFYNTVRIHSHCDYISPNDFEKLYERVMSLQAA